MAEVSVLVLCVILFGAAWSDIRCRKVKNEWLLVGAVCGLFLTGDSFLVSAGAVCILGFLGFRLGIFGAGDGKLAALIAGYLGLFPGLAAVFFGLVIGGVWSLQRLLCSRDLRIRLKYLSAWVWRVILTKSVTAYEMPRRSDGRDTIPLAACLAAGTYGYLAWQFAAAGNGVL